MTDPTTPADAGTAPDAQPQTFTAEYVAELRNEAKARRLQNEALTAQIEKANADNEAAAAAKLAEQGEFQTLAEQRAAEIEKLMPYKQQVETFIEAATASNQLFIESVPEDRRSLIPDGMAPLELQTYISTNRDLLMGQPYTVPATNGGAGIIKKPSGKPLSSSELSMAEKMGITPEAYQAAKAYKK